MAKLHPDMSPLLTKAAIENLGQRKIFTIIDVLQEDAAKLASISKLEFKDIVNLRKALITNYSPLPRLGLDVYNEMFSHCARIPSGILNLDDLLGGGFLTGHVFEICGLSGSGKTHVCLTAAANIALQTKRVVYFIDTKLDFSGSRVHSLLESKNFNEEIVGNVMEKILVTRVYNFPELYSFLYNLKNQLVREPGSIKILFIESLPAIFLQYMGNLNVDRLGFLNCFANLIKYIAHEQHVSIVIVNLATMWMEEDSAPLTNDEDETIAAGPHIDVKPVLGKFWTHVPNTRLFIDFCGAANERKITVIKSSHLAVGKFCNVSIVNDGVR